MHDNSVFFSFAERKKKQILFCCLYHPRPSSKGTENEEKKNTIAAFGAAEGKNRFVPLPRALLMTTVDVSA